MAVALPHGQSAVNPKELQLRFSPEVRKAFRSLAVATRSSPKVDSDMYEIMQQWSRDEPTTVHDYIVAFPLIAEQVADHIAAKDDDRAKDAWREICMQMPEKGFVISRSIQRVR